MKTAFIIIAAAVILGFVFGLLPFGKSGEPDEYHPGTVVHVHNHPPRQCRENVFQRVKRKQEEQRKAYHESEWKHYGNYGPW